jgi:hypothetical protein
MTASGFAVENRSYREQTVRRGLAGCGRAYAAPLYDLFNIFTTSGVTNMGICQSAT